MPAAVRRALEEHARAEAPNEACGLILFRNGVVERYEPGRNAAASPYRFELYLDPERWADIGDTNFEQAVVHSHLSSPPRPSRTDVENIGLWAGKPYLIYSVREDDLAAWLVTGGEIEPLELQS